MFDWFRLRGRRPKTIEVFEVETDARPSDRIPQRVEQDPEAKRRLKIRRRAYVLALCIVFGAGSLAALFAEGGYLDRRRLGAQTGALQIEVENRRARISLLAEQVRRLETDPLAKERIARERLGLVKPGEIDFLLPRERPGEIVEP